MLRDERLREHPPEVRNWAEWINQRYLKIPGLQVNPDTLGHLAIIENGRRNAASNRGLDGKFGYTVSCDTALGIARVCRDWGIPNLTLGISSVGKYGFSGEIRDKRFHNDELAAFLSDESFEEYLLKSGTRFTHIGSKQNINAEFDTELTFLEVDTAANRAYRFNLVMEYDFLDYEYNTQLNDDLPLIDLVVNTGTARDVAPIKTFLPGLTAKASWINCYYRFPDIAPETLLGIIKQYQNK